MPVMQRPSSHPLRKALPAPVRGLQDIVAPPDEMPMPGGVTIGPKAIPLGDEEGYLRQVMSKVAPDLVESSRAFVQRPLEGMGEDIVKAAINAPGIRQEIAKGMRYPAEIYQKIADHQWNLPNAPQHLKPAIKALSNIMLGLPPD